MIDEIVKDKHIVSRAGKTEHFSYSINSCQVHILEAAILGSYANPYFWWRYKKNYVRISSSWRWRSRHLRLIAAKQTFV